MLEQLTRLARTLSNEDKALDLVKQVVEARPGLKVVNFDDLETIIARANPYNLGHVKSSDITSAGDAAPSKGWKGYAAVTNLRPDARPKLNLKLNLKKKKNPEVATSADPEISSHKEDGKQPTYRIGASDYPNYVGLCVEDGDTRNKAEILTLNFPRSLQIGDNRHVFRQATRKKDVLDWSDRERGPARYSNCPITAEEFDQLVNNIRDLLNTQMVIEDRLDVVGLMDRAEETFIQALESASIAFAKLLNDLGLLPLRLYECRITMVVVAALNDEADNATVSGADGAGVPEIREETEEDIAEWATTEEEEDDETSVKNWL